MILLSLLPNRSLLSRQVGFADRSIKPPKGYRTPMEASCGHFRTSFIMIYALQRLICEKDLIFLNFIIRHIVCQVKNNTIYCGKKPHYPFA
jgi:hypothetical protein